MDKKAQTFRAEDAQHLLNNPVWKMIWAGMREHLDTRELSCNVAKEPEIAQDIVRCKQLLHGLEREIQRVIDAGTIAEIRLQELEKRTQKVRQIVR